jgi:hypothetical protein
MNTHEFCRHRSALIVFVSLQNIRRTVQILVLIIIIMLFDNLAVFVVALISLLLFSSISVHGFPVSTSAVRYFPRVSSADLSSSFGLMSSMTNPSDDDPSDIVIGNNRHGLPIASLFALYDDYEQEETPHKRSSSSSLSSSSSGTAAELNFKSALKAPASPHHGDNLANMKKLSKSGRLSPALQALVENNPVARYWLTLLLQKMATQEPTTYIFKYGRRR